MTDKAAPPITEGATTFESWMETTYGPDWNYRYVPLVIEIAREAYLAGRSGVEAESLDLLTRTRDALATLEAATRERCAKEQPVAHVVDHTGDIDFGDMRIRFIRLTVGFPYEISAGTPLYVRPSVQKEPSGQELCDAFFSGNPEMVSPWGASPSELENALRAVWNAGSRALSPAPVDTVCVPREPTMSMQLAALQWIRNNPASYNAAGARVHVATEIYKAMLAEAPVGTSGGEK